MNTPIFHIEIANMRYTIQQALLNYADCLGAELQKAVDEYLTPEHVGKIIRQTVERKIDAAVKEKVLALMEAA